MECGSLLVLSGSKGSRFRRATHRYWRGGDARVRLGVTGNAEPFLLRMQKVFELVKVLNHALRLLLCLWFRHRVGLKQLR